MERVPIPNAPPSLLRKARLLLALHHTFARDEPQTGAQPISSQETFPFRRPLAVRVAAPRAIQYRQRTAYWHRLWRLAKTCWMGSRCCSPVHISSSRERGVRLYASMRQDLRECEPAWDLVPGCHGTVVRSLLLEWMDVCEPTLGRPEQQVGPNARRHGVKPRWQSGILCPPHHDG